MPQQCVGCMTSIGFWWTVLLPFSLSYETTRSFPPCPIAPLWLQYSSQSYVSHQSYFISHDSFNLHSFSSA